MRVSVCRPGELGASELARWQALQRAGGLENPFLSPQFACDVDAVTDAARVAVVHDGAAIVGFLAYEQRPLRTARGIGGVLANRQALICAPQAGISIREVLRGAGVDAFAFHALSVPAAGIDEQSMRAVEARAIDLRVGFDSYLAAARAAGGRFVKQVERNRRRLHHAHPGTVRFEFATREPAAVARVIGWKTAQYRRTGRPNPFASRAAQELIARLAQRDEQALGGCVSLLSVDGRPVAGDLSLRSTQVLAGWVTSYDMQMAKWSPGTVTMLSLIEAASRAGLSTFDLGTGEALFKERLANTATQLAQGWIARPSVAMLVTRAIHSPGDWTRRYVQSHPRARDLARRARCQYGTLRTQLASSAQISASGRPTAG